MNQKFKKGDIVKIICDKTLNTSKKGENRIGYLIRSSYNTLQKNTNWGYTFITKYVKHGSCGLSENKLIVCKHDIGVKGRILCSYISDKKEEVILEFHEDSLDFHHTQACLNTLDEIIALTENKLKCIK